MSQENSSCQGKRHQLTCDSKSVNPTKWEPFQATRGTYSFIHCHFSRPRCKRSMCPVCTLSKTGYYFPHISAAVLTFTPTAGKGAKSRDPASRCFLVHLVLRRKSPLLLKLLEVVCTSVVYPSFLERQPINPILCNPWTSNLYPPGSLSEMQNRRPHPKSSESESAFWQESWERHLPLNNHWFRGVSSWTSWLKFEGRRKESAEVAKELKTLLQKGKLRSPGLSRTERRSWELNS